MNNEESLFNEGFKLVNNLDVFKRFIRLCSIADEILHLILGVGDVRKVSFVALDELEPYLSSSKNLRSVLYSGEQYVLKGWKRWEIFSSIEKFEKLSVKLFFESGGQYIAKVFKKFGTAFVVNIYHYERFVEIIPELDFKLNRYFALYFKVYRTNGFRK